MRNIFVISHDKFLAKSIGEKLDREMCSIYTVSEQDILRYLQIGDVDIIIVDTSYQGINIEHICTQIREINQLIGLMVIGDNLPVDQIKRLFEVGIDHYMCHDVSMEQLGACLGRMCQRVEQIKQHKNHSLLVSGPFILDGHKRLLHKNGEMVKLTAIEYEMMKYFMMNQQVAISRDQLLDWVWGNAYIGDPKVIDVNVMRLRQKIEENPKKPNYIGTVWGYGYRWEGC
ncbi:MAG: winged helix-turn-helix transcriptional regulator [Cellulosilyticaceae bacterium]